MTVRENSSAANVSLVTSAGQIVVDTTAQLNFSLRAQFSVADAANAITREVGYIVREH
jgi:hypothetical protein